MLGCQSALVSPQSRRSHLKFGALPVFARPFPTGASGRVRASRTNECRAGVWFGGVRVGGVAFECQCCWGFDPRADQHGCAQRGHGRNQGTTRQMTLQYSRCERAGARWSPRFTCLHGEGSGGSVDEASLSSRQDHHHRDRRAGPPCVVSWPVPPLCATGAVGGWVYIRIGCRGQTRAGQHARTKIDEDEMKESWFLGWLGVVRFLCRLRSCLPSSPLETGAMKGKKRVSAQNRPGGGRDDGVGTQSIGWSLAPSMHAIMPHLACDTGRNPIFQCHPMPCSGPLLTGHAWVSEGDFVRC